MMNFTEISTKSEIECPIISSLGDPKNKPKVFKTSLSNKFYAVKVFQRNMPKFLRESSFAKLSHPNLLTPSIVGENASSSLILTEYCEFGSFINFISKLKLTEKLARTYFRQLVEALEHLHNHGRAHLDIKLDNLFLTEDYTLKLGDFDLSFTEGDEQICSSGSVDYRAPEVIDSSGDYDPYSADIYSLGIVLFLLTNGKYFPFMENFSITFAKYYRDPSAYWGYWKRYIYKSDDINWSDDFKELFQWLVKKNPWERASIREIKGSAWYKGEIYTENELKDFMKVQLEK